MPKKNHIQRIDHKTIYNDKKSPNNQIQHIFPESVNFHLTQICNYRCKFCFAIYDCLERELNEKEAIRIIDELVKHNCLKINFAGGEPTLVKFLPNLIKYSKDLGLFVSLISNGTGISQNFLDKCGNSLDLIGLSVDSNNDTIERKLGRSYKNSLKINSNYSHIDMIMQRAETIHDYGIDLKINTTLTPLNWKDDLTDFLSELNPKRWKVFEVHRIYGINDSFFEKFGTLEQDQFNFFIKKHSKFNPVYETSEMILDSYCMITPDGRFYQNTENIHHYSKPILNIGLMNAFNQISFSTDKYHQRKGDYFKSKGITNSHKFISPLIVKSSDKMKKGGE
ncbi:MAG: viperin family antiviral radical SAM protein [Promethearchaeota archaeon]